MATRKSCRAGSRAISTATPTAMPGGAPNRWRRRWCSSASSRATASARSPGTAIAISSSTTAFPEFKDYKTADGSDRNETAACHRHDIHRCVQDAGEHCHSPAEHEPGEVRTLCKLRQPFRRARRRRDAIEQRGAFGVLLPYDAEEAEVEKYLGEPRHGVDDCRLRLIATGGDNIGEDQDGARIEPGAGGSTPRQPGQRRLLHQSLRIEALNDVVAVRHLRPDLYHCRAQAVRRLYAGSIGFDAGDRHSIAGQGTSERSHTHAGVDDTISRILAEQMSRQMILVFDQHDNPVRQAAAVVVLEPRPLQALLCSDLLQQAKEVAVEKIQAHRWSKIGPHVRPAPCRSPPAAEHRFMRMARDLFQSSAAGSIVVAGAGTKEKA